MPAIIELCVCGKAVDDHWKADRLGRRRRIACHKVEWRDSLLHTLLLSFTDAREAQKLAERLRQKSPKSLVRIVERYNK